MATTPKPAIKKVVLNMQAGLQSHMNSAVADAADKFSRAAQIVEQMPTAFTVAEQVPTASAPSPADATTVKSVQEFTWELCVPGAIVRAPLHLIDLNQVSPRQIYTETIVDKVAETFAEGQDDAAHGYVENQRIKLIDGGTRYRASKATGDGFLDVKIEEAPKSALDLFNRARALNENRSDTTPLDFALSMKQLLALKAVGSQRELLDAVKGPDGMSKMSEASLSMYLKISRMPDRIQKLMHGHPSTSTVAALHAVSDLVTDVDEDILDQRIEMAIAVIDDIKRGKLNRAQIIALVKAKLNGPKKRDRATSYGVSFFGQKADMKCFPKKGRLELVFNGLTEEELAKFTDTIRQAGGLPSDASAEKSAPT